MTKPFKIVLMGGDGIGPEIVDATLPVIDAAISTFDLNVDVSSFKIGQLQFEASGYYLCREAEKVCDALAENGQGAILFGAVASEPIGILRKKYDLFANLRPLKILPSLGDISRLKRRDDRNSKKNIDLLIVRELISGLYYGHEASGTDKAGRWATQEMRYHETDIRRIAKMAFEQAQKRNNKITFVHKVNAIPGVFGLWTTVITELASDYPEVLVDDILVDNMAMQMILRPGDFDVVLCSNMFGDILSDLAAGIIGSIGVCPSASINAVGFGLYESIGGCAPDIAGENRANPLSTILSLAMMCRISLGRDDVAEAIEVACETVLGTHRTADIWQEGRSQIGCAEMGNLIAQSLMTQSKTSPTTIVNNACSTGSLV